MTALLVFFPSIQPFMLGLIFNSKTLFLAQGMQVTPQGRIFLNCLAALLMLAPKPMRCSAYPHSPHHCCQDLNTVSREVTALHQKNAVASSRHINTCISKYVHVCVLSLLIFSLFIVYFSILHHFLQK